VFGEPTSVKCDERVFLYGKESLLCGNPRGTVRRNVPNIFHQIERIGGLIVCEYGSFRIGNEDCGLFIVFFAN
jgi:hypothetical protein